VFKSLLRLSVPVSLILGLVGCSAGRPLDDALFGTLGPSPTVVGLTRTPAPTRTPRPTITPAPTVPADTRLLVVKAMEAMPLFEDVLVDVWALEPTSNGSTLVWVIQWPDQTAPEADAYTAWGMHGLLEIYKIAPGVSVTMVLVKLQSTVDSDGLSVAIPLIYYTAMIPNSLIRSYATTLDAAAFNAAMYELSGQGFATSGIQLFSEGEYALSSKWRGSDY